MKAAHNGIPSLSVLDGWWLEGHVEDVTGWSIGQRREADTDLERATAEDADDLLRKLEGRILPLFHRDRAGWIRVMKSAVAFNASFFNAHRMVMQYAANAYL